MRPVRIGQIARRINLMRLDSLKNRPGEFDVARRDSAIPALVERKIQVMQPLLGNLADRGGFEGFQAPDQSFVRSQVGIEHFPGRTRPCFQGKPQVLPDGAGWHGIAAGNLVGNMDFVPVVGEADQCSSHRDDIVVRVRRKNQDAAHALFGNSSAGPSGNGVLN